MSTPGHLNPSQRLHLLSSCQYADKLLSEIEATLAASQSKSPFPKFKPDISPAQVKVVQDYIARMRAQLVRILDAQGVPIPAPHIGSVHSIRVTLGFADIAFDEFDRAVEIPRHTFRVHARLETVEYSHVITLPEQPVSDMRADKPCPSRYKRFHDFTSLFIFSRPSYCCAFVESLPINPFLESAARQFFAA